MEKIAIEIPVKVGDKMYRTDKVCSIEEGTVISIEVSGLVSDSSTKLDNTINIRMTVHFKYCDDPVYNVKDIGEKIFTSKMELVKHIMKDI